MQPRTRFALVLMVAAPLCAFAVLWNVSLVRYYVMVDDPAKLAAIVSPWGRGLHSLLLFPVMVACYFLATTEIPRRVTWQRVLAKQLGLLLVFASLTRPLLFFAMQAARGGEEAGPLTAHQFAAFLDMSSVLTMSLNYSLIYALGLSLLFGLITFAKYRQEQLRASLLRAHFLQAQLETLRVQLHPHFLFNTLNTISALVTTKPEAARDLIAELSAFLRESVSEAREEFYPLGRECDLARRYLRIIAMRFGSRFKPLLQVPQALEQELVPHGILLTLLENGVTHGVSAITTECQLSLECALKDGFLRVEVHNEYDAHLPASTRTGGLAALRTRLKALYGDAFRLDYGGDGKRLWTLHLVLPILAPAQESGLTLAGVSGP